MAFATYSAGAFIFSVRVSGYPSLRGWLQDFSVIKLHPVVDILAAPYFSDAHDADPLAHIVHKSVFTDSDSVCGHVFQFFLSAKNWTISKRFNPNDDFLGILLIKVSTLQELGRPCYISYLNYGYNCNCKKRKQCPA